MGCRSSEAGARTMEGLLPRLQPVRSRDLAAAALRAGRGALRQCVLEALVLRADRLHVAVDLARDHAQPQRDVVAFAELVIEPADTG